MEKPLQNHNRPRLATNYGCTSSEWVYYLRAAPEASLLCHADRLPCTAQNAASDCRDETARRTALRMARSSRMGPCVVASDTPHHAYPAV